MLPKHWLSKFDAFCVPFTPAISDSQQQYYHGSACGGFLSIIIATLSLSYFSYSLYQWQNWQLIPKVTQYPNEKVNNKEYRTNIATYQLEIQNVNYGEQYINSPFAQQNNILTPFRIRNYDLKNIELAFPKVINKFDDFLVIYQFDINIVEDYIIFCRCEQKYLSEGQWCADEEVIDSYFQFSNELTVVIAMESINPFTFQKYSPFRVFSIGIDEELCQTNFFYLQQQTFELDNGVGFNSIDTKNFISDFTQQSYTTTNEFCEQFYNRKAIAAVYMSRDNIFTLWKIQYPSIFEVLGNVESIISLMLFCKYIIMEINRRVMRSQMVDTIVKQYYPEIQQCIIKTNLWGKIKEITLNKKKIEVQSFQTFLKHAREQYQCKLSFTNLIYEVSRLQYITQSLQKREYLKKCHHVGIRLKLRRNIETDQYEVVDEKKLLLNTTQFIDNRNELFKNTDILNLEDAILLSHRTKEIIQQDIQVKNYRNKISMKPIEQHSMQRNEELLHKHYLKFNKYLCNIIFKAANQQKPNLPMSLIIQSLRLFCDTHPSELFTNFCCSPDCLQPLCPDCIEQHNRFHRQNSTFPDTDSIKNVKNLCSRKIQSGIQEIQKLIDEIETQSQSEIEDKTLHQILKAKEAIIGLVNQFFNELEEKYRKHLEDQNAQQMDVASLQRNISTQLNQLEYLNASLEGSSALHAIKRVCTLDLKKIIEKFKKQIKLNDELNEVEQVALHVNEKYVQSIKQQLHGYLQLEILTNQSKIQPNQLSTVQQTTHHKHQPSKDYFKGKNKYLHFFQSETSNLWLYDLDNQSIGWRLVQISNQIIVPTFSKSLITPEGTIYLIGGSLASNKKCRSVYLFNYSNNQLVEIANMITSRSSHGVVYRNNEIVIVGGFTENQKMTHLCEVIDTKSWKVKRIASLPQPVASPGLCVFNDSIIKCGGLDQTLHVSQSIEIYVSKGITDVSDVQHDKWITVQIQNLPQLSAMMCVIQMQENQILLFGGYLENNKGTNQAILIEIKGTSGKSIEAKQLLQAEGFWNNQPIQYGNKIYALQNVAELNGESCLEDQRRIVVYNGDSWSQK